MRGIPVVIVESGGVPIRPAEARGPVMTVAENGAGMPITLTDRGAPFIVQGLDEPPVDPEPQGNGSLI